MSQIQVDDEKTVYVVFSNTDLTEGRGREFGLRYCEKEATAQRLAKGAYVQGTNSRVQSVPMYLIKGAWYAPHVLVEGPTHADLALERELELARQKQAAKDAALQAARAAGLTEEQIAALSD